MVSVPGFHYVQKQPLLEVVGFIDLSLYLCDNFIHYEILLRVSILPLIVVHFVVQVQN